MCDLNHDARDACDVFVTQASVPLKRRNIAADETSDLCVVPSAAAVVSIYFDAPNCEYSHKDS